MKALKIVLIIGVLIVSLKLEAQSPIEVTITEDCNPVTGTFSFNYLLNGKNNYIHQVVNDVTGEVVDFQVGFDGVIWVMYVDNDLTAAGFYNQNIPNGVLPPNTGWQVFDCDNGTMTITGGVTVSVDEYSVSRYLKTSPNPFKNNITINNPKQEKLKIVIYDELGRAVLISNETQLNTQNLKEGIYFIKIQNEAGESYSTKMIKN